MQIALLGPLEVTDDERPVPVSGGRLRALLLRLAADAGRVVSAGELMAAVWGDELPADEANALQTLVSRLRRALGESATVQQSANGYRLAGVQIDVERFHRLVAQARTSASKGNLADAVELYREAEALWRGTPLVEVAEQDWAAPLVTRWQDERMAARLGRIDAEIRLGETAGVIAELEDLIRLFPLHERLSQQLMTALAAAGRPSDGLAAYDRLRRTLAEQLGADPSAESRQLHQRLLRATDAEQTPTRTARRTNLKAPLTSFLGRDDEVKRLTTLLESGRLATVVGPGGAGKTRLAGVLAGMELDRMPDGVWLVELAPVTDPAEIAQAVLAALGIWADQLLERGVELTRKPTAERLLEVLADAECLLVMDNCEYLINPVADLVGRLLGGCPGLKVLATSREPLGIDGEALCVVPPLTLPEPDVGPGAAQSYPSVQLFADRAAAVRAEFRIDEATVASVVEIVRRLDGLPLAIELAAARLRVMPVAEVAARLSDRFRLLTGGSRTAMPRHRTLRAVVEWSWELLTEGERLLAERLAIFPSGAGVDSAQAVCADDRLPAEEVLDLLSALVDKSLLRVVAEAPVRYQMLETIREYGVERLAERGELDRLRLLHARHFARLAGRHAEALRGPAQLDHLRVLEAERDNILSALAFLAESAVPDEAVELAYALCWYWTMLGRHTEAERWLSLVLSSTTSDSPHRMMAAAMRELNRMATMFGTAGAEFDTSLARLADLNERLGRLDTAPDPTLPLLRAIMSFFGGSPEDSYAALDSALRSPDAWVRASALMFRANLAENDGDLARMRRDAEAAAAAFGKLGDRWGMASTATSLAQLKVLDGDLPGAIADYEQAAGYLAEFGALPDESMLHLRLAELYLRTGDLAAAKERIRRTRAGEFPVHGRGMRLMADATQAMIASIEGDAATIRTMRARLAAELDQLRPVNPLNGHVHAVALAALAGVLVDAGELAEARRRLELGYGYALATQDMPIVAQVALATARWTHAIGQPLAAAEIYGAVAQLRGAPDPTDPYGSRLARELVGELGPDRFEQAVQRGRMLDRAAALDRVRPTCLDE